METSTNCNIWQGGMSGLVEKQSTLTGLGISQRMVRQTLRTVSGSQWVRRRGEGGTTLLVVCHTGKDTEILYTLSVKLMQFRWRRHWNSLKVYSFIISFFYFKHFAVIDFMFWKNIVLKACAFITCLAWLISFVWSIDLWYKILFGPDL